LFSAAIIIAGVVGFRYLLSIPPSSVVQADDGFKKANATIDPEKLRAWALEEIAKYKPSTNDIAGKDIPNSELPDYIQTLYPYPAENATVWIDENQPSVMITWGGGFFHWMIDIGPTNYTETTGSTGHFTTVEWVPGVYYRREDTRHPFK
jgi:hypothetical protein